MMYLPHEILDLCSPSTSKTENLCIASGIPKTTLLTLRSATRAENSSKNLKSENLGLKTVTVDYTKPILTV